MLKLCNRIKAEQIFPEVLEKCDITAIYKNKGERNDFNNYRGIFRVPIIRAILDRLIYNDEYLTIDEALTDSNVGARKGRNIRDNIFILNAVTNSVINGPEEAVDIQIFDVEKCFDTLWVQECINDLFDAGFNNDKLPILYLENKNAKIAIKTANGTSKRETIHNIIMQGTVWGSLCCTATMDKLGQIVYKNEDLIYKYKDEVDIPCLGMVDDIMCIQKCNIKSVEINAAVNAFIESKKLTLSKTKCHRIHIARKSKNTKECEKLKVHEDKMEDTTKSKYLGDIIDNSGKIRANIEERRAKGFAIVNEILAILEEIPLGRFRMEIGLKLRKAMLINGILYNSEAWHNVREKEIKRLEEVDEHFLRTLVHGHAKTPIEFIYLETGSIPIRYILGSRRMCFLQTILKREDRELTKKVYRAQTKNPVDGDFYMLVKEDFNNIGEEIDEIRIANTSTNLYKEHIKKKTRAAAFENLKRQQKTHSKVKEIKYTGLETQCYITSPIFNDTEVSLLFAMRSNCVRQCKANFSSQYKQSHDILCIFCSEKKPDDQKHLLECKGLIKHLKSEKLVQKKIDYSDIYEDTLKQKNVTALFSELLKVKKELTESYHPSTSCPEVLKTSYNVQP